MKSRTVSIVLMSALTCAMLSSPVHAGLFSKAPPAPIDVSAATPASALSGVWKNTGRRASARPTKVMIANFRVVVLTHVAGMGSTTPGFANDNGGSASISAFYTLNGVDTQAMQAMANAAYLQLQNELTASGYSLVPRSALDGIDDAGVLAGDASLGRVQYISAQNGASSGYMFTPTDLPVKLPLGGQPIEQDKAVWDANGKGFMRSLSKAASLTAAAQSQYAATKVASRAGVTLLDVTYMFTFASFKGTGSGGGMLSKLAGNDTAKLTSTVSPILVPEDTMIQVFRPSMGDNGTLALQTPLSAQGNAFSAMRNTTTTGDKAGAVAGAVVSGLIALASGSGGINLYQTKRYVVDASVDLPTIIGGAVQAANRSVPAAITQ